MPTIGKILVVFGITCQIADAAPSAFNVIQPRDELVQYDAFYQEIVHIVTMTSTVYVAAAKSTPTPAPSPMENQASHVETQQDEHEEPEKQEKQENAPPPPPAVVAAPPLAAQPVAAPPPVSSAAQPIEKKDTSSSAAQGYSGKATFYTPGMGSCGWTNTESDCIVALSHTIMAASGSANPNANPLCGKMVDISCKGTTVTAKVVDTCPGCASEGDIDLSPSCFEKLAPKDDGTAQVSWGFAS